jgi:glucarate dehydratase
LRYVAEGAGLGVELDRAALAKAHATYKRAGLKERNDEIEMQKKVPGGGFRRHDGELRRVAAK